MLRRTLLAALCALGPSILPACAGSVVSDGHQTAARPDSTAPPEAPPEAPPASPPSIEPAIVITCAVADDACELGGDPCCAGLHCADTGYGQGSCRLPEPNGSFCWGPEACQSGICHQYTCVDALPACVGLGVYCADGTPCCEGYCTPQTYAIESGICAPLLEAGSSCNDDSECAGHACVEYVCAP